MNTTTFRIMNRANRTKDFTVTDADRARGLRYGVPITDDRTLAIDLARCCNFVRHTQNPLSVVELNTEGE